MKPSAFSVVVPTQGVRPGHLRECLRSLAGQEFPPGEILVVANGADPKAILRLSRGLAPRLRVLHEPVLGVDRARNRGLIEARGRIAAFVDDDCLAPSGWLNRLAACFREPDVIGAGGPARPRWEGRPPASLLRSARAIRLLGAFDLGRCRRAIDPDSEFLIGANMAFRLQALAESGGLRAVCRFPGLGVCGSDFELSRRLARRGRVLYEPRAWLWHRMRPSKSCWPHALWRAFCYAAVGSRLGGGFRPVRGARELAGWEGALSTASALGHVYGRLPRVWN